MEYFFHDEWSDPVIREKLETEQVFYFFAHHGSLLWKIAYHGFYFFQLGSVDNKMQFITGEGLNSSYSQLVRFGPDPVSAANQDRHIGMGHQFGRVVFGKQCR